MTLSKHCLYTIYRNLFSSPAWRSLPMIFFPPPNCEAFLYLVLDNLNLTRYCIILLLKTCEWNFQVFNVTFYHILYNSFLERKWLEVKYWVICSNCFYGLAEQGKKKKKVKQVPHYDHPYSQPTQAILYCRQNIRHSNKKFGILFPNFLTGQLCARNFPFLCPTVRD